MKNKSEKRLGKAQEKKVHLHARFSIAFLHLCVVSGAWVSLWNAKTHCNIDCVNTHVGLIADIQGRTDK